MGSLGLAGKRRLLLVVALSAPVVAVLVAFASAAGPGGWGHVGDHGTPGTKSLNLVANALEATPGGLYVGGKFTDAGGIPNADRIAIWNGSSWSAVSSSTEQIGNGEVFAIAVSGGKVYAGGVFTNAGNSGADNLAVWDGTSWEPFCTSSTETIGNVRALQVVGPTLYVGGDFQDGAGIETADYLLACDLASGMPDDTTVDPMHPFSGPVKALTATSDGTLYAGGRFGNLENIAAADDVAYLPQGGSWHAMGSGGGPCGCALDAYVRGLTASGTDVYVGTEGSDVAGIAQADHVVKWNGSAWSAMGSNTAGADGWFPAATNIYDLASVGSIVIATGTFQNANGDGRADNIAFFDGSDWHPVGSNGAVSGPWVGEGSALAVVDRQLYAAGNFTSAGGDTQAQSIASFSLTQIIAYPTPTVTQGPGPQPTPTVTPAPPAADVTAPATTLGRARINQATRKATFRFASSEPGSTFSCKLDKRKLRRCSSPKTYKKLAPGKHVFRVKARDYAGNLDTTPVVRRFKIKRR
jgi:trimeric autotransporter adhesin